MMNVQHTDISEYEYNKINSRTNSIKDVQPIAERISNENEHNQ